MDKLNISNEQRHQYTKYLHNYTRLCKHNSFELIKAIVFDINKYNNNQDTAKKFSVSSDDVDSIRFIMNQNQEDMTTDKLEKLRKIYDRYFELKNGGAGKFGKMKGFFKKLGKKKSKTESVGSVSSSDDKKIGLFGMFGKKKKDKATTKTDSGDKDAKKVKSKEKTQSDDDIDIKNLFDGDNGDNLTSDDASDTSLDSLDDDSLDSDELNSDELIEDKKKKSTSKSKEETDKYPNVFENDSIIDADDPILKEIQKNGTASDIAKMLKHDPKKVQADIALIVRDQVNRILEKYINSGLVKVFQNPDSEVMVVLMGKINEYVKRTIKKEIFEISEQAGGKMQIIFGTKSDMSTNKSKVLENSSYSQDGGALKNSNSSWTIETDNFSQTSTDTESNTENVLTDNSISLGKTNVGTKKCNCANNPINSSESPNNMGKCGS